jgi:hypothetical protein
MLHSSLTLCRAGIEFLEHHMLLIPLFVAALFSIAFFALEAPAGFVTAPAYPAGMLPTSIAVGDFNGDGIPDLVVANSGSNIVSVLLGKGDGTFQTAHSYAAGSDPICVAVGDFNGDGVLDLAVANKGSAKVSILLGNGDGTFQAAQSYDAGSNPQSVVVGDFNRDGHADLAVANDIFGAGTVTILLGNGDGTFQAAHSYDAGFRPWSVAVADFNGDGLQDLAVASNVIPGTVSILLGNGDGTFQVAQDYAVGLLPQSVAVGDFNGDGHLDLVVANAYSGTVSVLLGNGDGTFQAAQSYTVGGSASVAVGDFNGDGRLDVAVAGGSAVSILLGNGDGTFQDAQSYAAGFGPQSVAVGDFNRDGHPDLAVANGGGDPIPVGTVSILLGKGNGAFQAAQSYVVGSYPFSVAVGDFNGDGIPDLAIASQGTVVNTGTVSVLLGNGDGTFRLAGTFDAGSGPNSIAVADFNGDGRQDIVTTNFYESVVRGVVNIIESDVRVFLGNGDGTFQAAEVFTVGLGPVSVAVGDFDGDGILDLALANGGGYLQPGSTVSILLGNGDGTFKDAHNYDAGPSPRFVAVGDFNRDGIADLVVANISSNSVSVLLGNGDGTFAAPQSYAVGSNPDSVAVGDFNGDGILDLAVANGGSATVSILLGNGDGTFKDAQSYAVDSSPQSVAIGDFNRDGVPDLAVASIDTGAVSILLGQGDGTFRDAQSYNAGSNAGWVAVGDFNGDGFPDLAIANTITPGTVTILLNAADWNGGHGAVPPRRSAPPLP